MPLREIVILASVYEFGSSIVDGLLRLFADEIFYPFILRVPLPSGIDVFLWRRNCEFDGYLSRPHGSVSHFVETNGVRCDDVDYPKRA